MTTPKKTIPKTLHQRRLSPVKSFRLRTDVPAPDPNPSAPNLPFRGDPVSEANKERGHLKQGREVSEVDYPKGGGPRTPKGKAISARNATTHGLFCRQTVLPHLKIERLMRLQATLRRQLDKSVKMLRQEVPALYNQRLRERELAYMGMSEAQIKQDPFYEKVIAKVTLQEQVINEARQGLPQDFPLDTLEAANKNCQNEPACSPPSLTPPSLEAGGPPPTPSLFGADTHPCDPRTLNDTGTPPRRGEGTGVGPPLVKPKLNAGNPESTGTTPTSAKPTAPDDKQKVSKRTAYSDLS